jgi:Amt family ammonium transporter
LYSEPTSFCFVSFLFYNLNKWAENGWLHDFGFLDFAGSGVVHLTGGMGALVGAILVGPRFGKFVHYDDKSEVEFFDEAQDRNFKKIRIVRDIPGHSATLYVLGTMILFVGWFSFNAG